MSACPAVYTKKFLLHIFLLFLLRSSFHPQKMISSFTKYLPPSPPQKNIFLHQIISSFSYSSAGQLFSFSIYFPPFPSPLFSILKKDSIFLQINSLLFLLRLFLLLCKKNVFLLQIFSFSVFLLLGKRIFSFFSKCHEAQFPLIHFRGPF